MKLAIPVWNDRVSPVFDTATCLMVLDILQGVEQGRQLVEIVQAALPTQRVRRLAELEVHVLVCGAISRPLAELVSSAGLVIIPWVSGPLDDVVQAYLADRLSHPRWQMPGCKLQHRHRDVRGAPRGPRRT
jgi:predicted Fe-Mo cluster-binding NifX family protein